MELTDQERLVVSYLKQASKPSFAQFCNKRKSEIVNESLKLLPLNALNMMRQWINIYNRVLGIKRPTAKLMNNPKNCSKFFKDLFDLYTALKKTNDQYTVSSIATLGNYATTAQTTLQGFLNGASNTVVTNDEEEELESETAVESVLEEISELEEADVLLEEKEEEEEEFTMEPTRALKFFTSTLSAYAQQRLLSNKSPVRVNIPLAQYSDVPFILLSKAAELIAKDVLDSNQIELLKLCLSQTVNLLNPDHIKVYKEIIPSPLYSNIIEACSNVQPKSFYDSPIIDEIFDDLKPFQFDKTTENVLNYLDEKKYMEKNKKSEKYKVLRLVEAATHNFKCWELEDEKEYTYAEATYTRKLADMLEILLEDEDVHIFDGEKVSKDTQRCQILNEDADNENGRKIDLMTKTKYNDVSIELGSIELKKKGVDENISKYQQSKNIRSNMSILNNINNITKQQVDLFYMDWNGREGYLAHIFKFNDIMITYLVDDLYMPKNMMELNDFKNTLQLFFFWRDRVINLGNVTRLAAYKEKRKFMTANLSAPLNQVDSPPRSPTHQPFFTPTNKRTRTG